MKPNIKMQKQNSQCPHCLQCICSGLFSCRTQLRLLRRAKRAVFVIQFILGFQCRRRLVVAVPGDWGVRGCIYYTERGAGQKQLPEASLKEKERIQGGGCCGVGDVEQLVQEQQSLGLCFRTAGLCRTSKQSVLVSAGSSAVSVLAESAAEVSFPKPRRFNWDYAFVRLDLALSSSLLSFAKPKSKVQTILEKVMPSFRSPCLVLRAVNTRRFLSNGERPV